MVRTLMGHVNRPVNASTALLASTALESGTLAYGSTSRSGTAGTYTDPYGTVQEAPANTPRVNNSDYVGYNLLSNPLFHRAVPGTTSITGTPIGTSHSFGSASGITGTIVGVGTDTTFKTPYIDVRIVGPFTVNSAARFVLEGLSFITAQLGETFTYSAYVSVVSGVIGTAQFSFELRDYNSGSAGSLTNGNQFAQPAVPTRYTVTRTTTDASVTHIVPILRVFHTVGVPFDVTLRFTAPQLEYGTAASSFIRPAPGAYGPAVNYTKPRLLVEESRTNYIRNPRAEGSTTGALGSGGVAPTNWTLTTGGTGIVPAVIGTGTEFGLPYIDVRFSGTSGASGNCSIYFETSTGIAAAQDQVWTTSFYARLVSGTYDNLAAPRLVHDENTSGGAYVTGNTSALTQFTPILSRYSATQTLTGATTGVYRPYIAHSVASAGLAVDITIRVYAPQAEQGAFATSLILPAVGTPAAAVRNNEDIIVPLSTFAKFGTSVTNMLPYSQDLDNAAWIKTLLQPITPNTHVAPDGTTTAELLVPDTVNGGHSFNHANFTFVAGTRYTFSFYAKANGYSYVHSRFPLAAFPSGNRLVGFDLGNGTVNGTEGNVAVNMVAVGSGWYRCSYSQVANNTASAAILTAINATNVGQNQETYIGDGVSGVQFWGVQLEATPVPLPTNLFQHPEELLSAAWTRFGTTSVAMNTHVAPDGTQSADTLTLTSASSGMQQSFTATPGVIYTVSAYIRADVPVTVSVSSSNNLSEVITKSVNVTTSWQRVEITRTGSVGVTSISLQISDTGAGGTVVQVWGMKAEIGSAASEYIPQSRLTSQYVPTVATTVTRTKLAPGTLVVKVKVPPISTTQNNAMVMLTDGTQDQRAGIRLTQGANNLDVVSFFQNSFGNSTSTTAQTYTAGTMQTFAYAWDAGNSYAAGSGGGSLTMPAVPPLGMTELWIGKNSTGQYFNGEIESVTYYPYRMSLTQLADITA